MVTFLNNGPAAIPGLVVMRIQDIDKLDKNFKEILVLINANHEAVQFHDPELDQIPYTLHAVQQESADLVLQEAKLDASSSTFNIPAITTAVFVVEETGIQLSQPVNIIVGTIVILMIASLVYLLTRGLWHKRPIAK